MGGGFNCKHTEWGSKGRNLRHVINSNNCKHISTGDPTYWPTDFEKQPDLIDFFIYNKIEKRLPRTRVYKIVWTIIVQTGTSLGPSLSGMQLFAKNERRNQKCDMWAQRINLRDSLKCDDNLWQTSKPTPSHITEEIKKKDNCRKDVARHAAQS